jgi:hypothetical protein
MELGYAVFEEIYIPMFLSTWQPVLNGDDPIEGLCEFFTAMYKNMSCDELVCGCPLNNLCQEMACIDEGFRLRILNMQQQLNQLIVNGLHKVSEKLRDDLDYSQVAYFIVASFHGSTTLSKSSRNKDLFEKVINELCKYIRALNK